jgi:hypothetical protein
MDYQIIDVLALYSTIYWVIKWLLNNGRVKNAHEPNIATFNEDEVLKHT